MVETARGLSLRVLNRVEQTDAFADVLLAFSLSRGSFESRDRALATELSYGVLRWRGRLDWVLSQMSHVPLADLEITVRNVLRIGAYQLMFLRVPHFAAIHETVELAKARCPRSQGFVNAILRRIAVEKHSIRYPLPVSDWLGYSVNYWSHPEWLVRYWSETSGKDEVEALLRANNQRSPVVLRVNRNRIARDQLVADLAAQGIHASKTAYSPAGIDVGGAICSESTAQGLWMRQSEGAQLISHLLDPRPGEKILDACAAPGGKSAHIAELMCDQGEVIALDVHPRNIEALHRRMQRAGVTIVKPTLADACGELRSIPTGGFDRILVDAPCTGLGTLRAHPEIKWKRSPGDITTMANLQRRILKNTADYLRKGGVLVYSTCTLTREENEDIVMQFLAERHDFHLESCRPYLPSHCAAVVDGSGFLKTFPHRHGLDGFFGARLRKAS